MNENKNSSRELPPANPNMARRVVWTGRFHRVKIYMYSFRTYKTKPAF